jgi:trk system potassium uptake protein TrkA
MARVVIIGCGRLGSALATSLSNTGHAVTVIDRDPAALRRLGAAFRGRYVAGHALDRPVLQQADLEHADACAVLTGNDAANAVISMVVRRRFRVPQVVTRCVEPQRATLLRRHGIAVVTPATWAAVEVERLLVAREVSSLVSLGSGEVELLALAVPPRLSGRRALELAQPGEWTIVALERLGRAMIPTERTLLEAGDILIVAVQAPSRARLVVMLEP